MSTTLVKPAEVTRKWYVLDAADKPLGRVAAQQMIEPKFSVTKDHGKFFDKQGTLFMATLHPAALLRNPNNKPLAFGDFVALRDKIHEVCTHTYTDPA